MQTLSVERVAQFCSVILLQDCLKRKHLFSLFLCYPAKQMFTRKFFDALLGKGKDKQLTQSGSCLQLLCYKEPSEVILWLRKLCSTALPEGHTRCVEQCWPEPPQVNCYVDNWLFDVQWSSSQDYYSNPSILFFPLRNESMCSPLSSLY